MKFTFKRISIAFIAFVLIVGSFYFTGTVKANPLFLQRKPSATATTSPTHLVRGTAIATTTNVLDSGQGNFGFDSATLGVQFTASSTSAVLGIRFEFSPGVLGRPDISCVTNEDACDWYSDDNMLITNASTTQDFLISAPVTYSWKYASSTDFCGKALTVTTAGDRRCKAFTVPVPMQYTRVVFFLTPGSTQNGAVFSEWIPKKQVNSN